MPLGKQREKVLYGIAAARGTTHRYTLIRWVVGVVATVSIALLPVLGILRFDLWGGRHMYLGEELGLVAVAKAFAFPFLAVNIAIVIASRFIGRYLCGFACPWGAFSRLAEWARFRNKKPVKRIGGTLVLLLLCGLVAAVTFSFWVDWRVFAEGSRAWVAGSAGFLIVTTVVLFAGARGVGLRFCKDYCPSGIYFAVLGPKTVAGIEFASPETCTECKACEKVCPMDLSPTEMSGGKHREQAGLYPDGMSNFALCIRCGDCVEVCEGTTGKNDGETPLRFGLLPAGARDDSDGGAVKESASGESGLSDESRVA